MDLTEKQISEYDENGWILLPELFSKGEISILEAAAMDVLQRRGPEVAREPNGVHMYARECIYLTNVSGHLLGILGFYFRWSS